MNFTTKSILNNSLDLIRIDIVDIDNLYHLLKKNNKIINKKIQICNYFNNINLMILLNSFCLP